ncbi:MAG: hypothetical protein AUI61_04310 [Thaumarchaeota archaeon 13_1_40CM_2_39_13_2]|nr:MAG: hypothetical protein AUI61_04310 [Thaumarchaeota archaeon 13_1_40CM_2_39_13_2]
MNNFVSEEINNKITLFFGVVHEIQQYEVIAKATADVGWNKVQSVNINDRRRIGIMAKSIQDVNDFIVVHQMKVTMVMMMMVC